MSDDHDQETATHQLTAEQSVRLTCLHLAQNRDDAIQAAERFANFVLNGGQRATQETPSNPGDFDPKEVRWGEQLGKSFDSGRWAIQAGADEIGYVSLDGVKLGRLNGQLHFSWIDGPAQVEITRSLSDDATRRLNDLLRDFIEKEELAARLEAAKLKQSNASRPIGGGAGGSWVQ